MSTQYYHSLETTLGKANLGPRQLTPIDRDDIIIQVVNDLLRREPRSGGSLCQDLLDSGQLFEERDGFYACPDGTDLVRFLAKKRNMEPHTIATQVLKEQKLSITTLFGENGEVNEIKGLPSPLTNPTGHFVPGNTPCVNPSKPEYILREERVPPEIPQQLTVENCTYVCHSVIPYAAKNGEIIGSIAAYLNHEQESFLLPLHTCEHVLSNGNRQPCRRIGWRHSQPPFINEDMMLSQPTRAILLCLDSLIAGKLLDFMNKKYLRDCIIPTCHLGGKEEFSRVNIDTLRGRDIVILPAPTVESYVNAYEYATRLVKHGARSVKISLHSLLCFPKPNHAPDVSQVSDPLLRHIITHALDIDGELSNKLVQKIIDEAFTHDKYYQWGLDIKIFKDKANKEINKNIHPMPVLDQCEQQDTVIYLDKIISPMLPAIIVGPSDGGKGMVGYTMSIGISFKKDVFHFSIMDRKKILYIDSEATTEEAQIKLSRIANGLGINKGTNIREEIDHWSLLSDEPKANANLGDEDDAFKNEIEERIHSSKSEVVVFDNLVSIAAKSYKSTKEFNVLFEWFLSLGKKYNVSVICMHHTNKTGEILGIGEIEDKFRTVFLLDDLEALKKEAKKDRTLYTDFLDQPGCLFRMRCKKSKSYPQLKQQRFGYFLKFNEKNPVQGENWICVEQSHFHAEDNGNMDIPLQSATSDEEECGVTKNLADSQHNESGEVFSDVATAENDGRGVDSQGSIPCAPSLAATAISASKKGKALDQNLDNVLDFAQKHGGWFKRAEIDELLGCKRQTSLNVLSAGKKKGLIDFNESAAEYRIRH